MFIELLKKKDFEKFAKNFYGSVYNIKKEDGKVILTLYCCDLDDNPITPFPEFTLTDFMLYLNFAYSIHQNWAINEWRTFLDEKAKSLSICNYGEKLKEFSPKEYEKWLAHIQQNLKCTTEKEQDYVSKLKPKHFIKLAKKLSNFIREITCEYQPCEKCWLVDFIAENYNIKYCFYDFDVEQIESSNFKNINYTPFLSLAKVKSEYFDMMSKLFKDYQNQQTTNLK